MSVCNENHYLCCQLLFAVYADKRDFSEILGLKWVIFETSKVTDLNAQVNRAGNPGLDLCVYLGNLCLQTSHTSVSRGLFQIHQQ